MQLLRLLAARRRRHSEEDEDEGPFFDLDFSSLRASSSSSCSSDDSDDSDLDFIISLHRSRSASPSYHNQFCSTKAGQATQYAGKNKNKNNKKKKTLSFRANNSSKKAAAFYGGRASFASSTRSLRLFMESPLDASDSESSDPSKYDTNNKQQQSGDVIRRCLTNISRRLRMSVRPRPAAAALRKSRSASAAVTLSRRDDSIIEKQDAIASAIAHCKDSFHSTQRATRPCYYGQGLILGNAKLLHHSSKAEVLDGTKNMPQFSEQETTLQT